MRAKHARVSLSRSALRLGIAALVPGALLLARSRRERKFLRPAAPAAAVAAPVAFWLSVPPGRARAAGTWALQMWAYKVLFELPYDRPWRLRRRLHVDYVLDADRMVGAGVPPSQRLQQLLRSHDRISPLDIGLTGIYFTWEAWPHAVLAWCLVRHPERFARAAANPWASMPSDHFGSSAIIALMLGEVGHGALGWTYALALGFALVYLGEHYVTDLFAGLPLAAGVKAVEPSLRRPASQLREAPVSLDARVKGEA